MAIGGTGVGRVYLIYRLSRFALHGVLWHRLVAGAVILVLLGVNLVQNRRPKGPRR
jgi:hypothetical protein